MSNRLIRDDDDAPAATPPPEPSAGVELTRAVKPRTFGRGPYNNRRQVTAHIEPQLFKWLQRIRMETDKPMVLIFEEALAAYVQHYAVQKKIG